MDRKPQVYIPFGPINDFLKKRVKKGTHRNFCKICPKLKKSQFLVKFQYSIPFCSPFDKKWSKITKKYENKTYKMKNYCEDVDNLGL
jgi:hypothetical protein